MVEFNIDDRLMVSITHMAEAQRSYLAPTRSGAAGKAQRCLKETAVSTMTALRTSGLSKNFSGFRAVTDVEPCPEIMSRLRPPSAANAS